MGGAFVTWCHSAAFAALGAGLVLGMVRLVKGPSLADRVVALDLIAYLSIGFMAVHAVDTGRAAFLDVAVALALFVFLGTVIFGRYIEATRLHGGLGAPE